MARPKTARVLRAALRVLVRNEFQGLSAARAAMRDSALLLVRFASAVDAEDAYRTGLTDNPEGGVHGWTPFSVEPWMASLKMVE